MQSNSMGTKPLAADHLPVAQFHFLHTLCSFVHAMLRFLAPKPKTDEKVSAGSARFSTLKLLLALAIIIKYWTAMHCGSLMN